MSVPNAFIIVYRAKEKDLADYLCEIIEAKDDSEERIIGVEDGSVTAIQMTEKEWAEVSSKQNIKIKVLQV